jgi:hypothetical protein
MPCVSSKYTEIQLRDILLNKEIKKVGEIQDPKEWAATMIKINKMVETKDVDASVLGSKYMDAMGLKKGDKISRYFLDTIMLAKKRGSDLQTIKMIKSLGLTAAQNISQKLDTVVKALGGTRIHFANQKIVESLLEVGSYKNLVKPSELDSTFQVLSDKEIASQTSLTIAQIAMLRQGLEYVLDKLNSIQNSIDSTKQAVVLTEQFILNPLKDTGGTIDLLVKFSDNTTGTLDYKTISPDDSKGSIDYYTGNIIDTNWIPNIKKIAIKEQLTDYNHTLETFYGSKGTVISRGIPIFIQYTAKPKGTRTTGETLTHHIKKISMKGMKHLKSDQINYLSHIPVQELVLLKDKKAQRRINTELGTLSIIINNKEKELSKLSMGTPKYTALSEEIYRHKEAMDKLILDQDFNALYDSFIAMLRNITKDGTLDSLYNIDDAIINGKENVHYLSNGELSEKIKEVQAMKNIIDASPYYLAEEGIKDTKKSQQYLKDIAILRNEVDRILITLKDKSIDRILNEDEQRAMEDNSNPSWWSRNFRSLGEQVAIPFRKLSSYLNTANDKKRLKLQEIFNTIENHVIAIEQASRRVGKNLNSMFEMMINPKTENLWGEHTTEFFKDLELAQKNKDNKWLDANLTRKANALEIYENNLAIFEANNAYHAQKDPESYKKRLDYWKSMNNPDALKYTNKYWLYYTISEKVDEKYYSEGYKAIRNIPELLSFYNYWTESMQQYNEMLGFRGDERIPKNFLPYIRQDIVGIISQGTFDIKNVTESMAALFAVRQDDTMFGDMTDDSLADPVTGKPKYNVPIFYTNPIKNAKGQIMRGVKLRDLSKSLFIFAEMAYNYHYLKTEVEPNLEGLRDYMMEVGMQQTTESKRKKKLLSGAWAKIRGESANTVQLFDKYVNYHLYGIKIQDAPKQVTKVVQYAKRMQANIELSLAPLLWTGNFVQIKTNAFIEGQSGFFYNKKQMLETMAEATGTLGKEKMELYAAHNDFFEFSPGRREQKIRKMSKRLMQKYIHTDTLHIGMRKAEEAINDNIGNSMLKNWAIVEGKLTRISNAPEGTKSIKDSSKLVDGVLVIEGLTDDKGNVTNIELYSQIRRMVISASSRIKGTLNPEDMSTIYMYLISNAAMGFKSWMPGMLDARFSSLRYSPNSNTMVEGRWMAGITDMARNDEAFFSWVGNVVVPKTSALLVNAATFGVYNMVAPKKWKYKVNEVRALNMFNKYKERYRHDPAVQNMEFKDFLEYKEGQLKALSLEVSMLLAIVGIVLALRGDWDDDEQEDWKANMMTRTMFRMLNRSRRELAFFISPSDWENLFRMPIPIMSMIPDTLEALQYMIGGIGDIVKGDEPVTKRGRSKFYYLWRRVPGNKLILIFEPDEMSKLREI